MVRITSLSAIALTSIPQAVYRVAADATEFKIPPEPKNDLGADVTSAKINCHYSFFESATAKFPARKHEIANDKNADTSVDFDAEERKKSRFYLAAAIRNKEIRSEIRCAACGRVYVFAPVFPSTLSSLAVRSESTPAHSRSKHSFVSGTSVNVQNNSLRIVMWHINTQGNWCETHECK